MRMTEIDYDAQPPVDSYGPGFFRVAGRVHEGGVLVLPEGLEPWQGYDAAPILAAADALDLVLVGTGAELQLLPAAFREAIEAAGIGLEQMATPAACRTYNVVLAEGRRVALAALPV
ncbi:Uncharacterized conserved protein, contains Mth938-like domain [Meinhardsimonia xiamenensis]|jgi:uncharacterized protein|uniref:Uncharacterized conserved protein, contains Mth938-like domain n=1 Tax=Meinhardsimonia xiamenensis TaxID=990712 RepID=A0A1G9FDF9_9RHOB|nr:Mth938-like domain-containing protein [Meinhardsimonia xiamenensis]PRX37898.1 uncharacterized protein LV81_00168 [Meinhardsimonia xiamenensis]SDK86233.1 Uncharacterized conserved protein, contains Mth938-like domain [Meinhardsimonia xiamenensis]